MQRLLKSQINPFGVRMEPELKKRVQLAADEARMSLNQYICQCIEIRLDNENI